MGAFQKTLNKFLHDQRGVAFPVALALLAVGTLVLTPLLNLTMSSIKSVDNEKRETQQYYAANAGISDGVWNLVVNSPQLPAVGENCTYSISETNGNIVEVIISRIEEALWEITSTATSNGEYTKLEVWVKNTTLLPNAISAGSVYIENQSTVNGDVLWDSATGTFENYGGVINGEIIDSAITWPTIEEVSAFYLEEVQGAPVYEGNLTLNLGSETVGNPYSLGPIYINGNFTLNGGPGEVRLDGPVYVAGGMTINQKVKLYMNNNTLFGQGALWTSSGATIWGYGSIVTKLGLSMSAAMDPDGGLILWSVQGKVTLGGAGETVRGAAYSPQQVYVDRRVTLTYLEFPPSIPTPPLLGSGFQIVGWESTRW